MTRRAAAIVFALTINPALVRAQDAAITVTVPSADVYKAPSNVTPIIGHIPQGSVLPISRNLGSWVRVAWPSAPDGVGYVHVSMGRLGPIRNDAASTAAAAAVAAPRTSSAITPLSQTPRPVDTPPAPRSHVTDQAIPRVQGSAAPASHTLGVGALVGYTRSVGVTTRAWSSPHIGFQFAVTHNTLTNDFSADRATTTQFEPGFMYGLFDRVTDYVWLRPYVGSTVTVRHVSTSAAVPEANTDTGIRVFGGAEFMFASMPAFGLSADLGYRHFQDPIPGFDISPVTLSIAGHWFIR
jgi:hypothetical protein